jgi:bifunctional DNA-binding transcriptional regulator/antitoxin component of YhaV-PrlF toxin-antitoxin module
MKTTITIPIEYLRGHQVHPGDRLLVISAKENEITMAISDEPNATQARSESLTQWLKTSKGLVSVKPNETVEELLDQRNNPTINR